ncbi:MAG TPA: hypothetical protein VIF09_13965, partial [Polyangiaceae bacterium]
ASIVALALQGVREIRQQTGVPSRTVGRWLCWWQGPFLDTEVFVTICARLIGVDVGRVPESIVGRLAGTWAERVGSMLEWLAPLTTGSVPDGARLLRGTA